MVFYAVFHLFFLFDIVPYSNSLSSEVFLGDGQTLHINNSACNHCIGLRPKLHYPKSTLLPMSTAHVPTATSTSFSEVSDNPDLPAVPSSVFPSADYVSGTFEPSPEPIRVRRAESTSAPIPVPALVLPPIPVASIPPPPHTSIGPVTQLDIMGSYFPVYDGQLDTSSNYTGFVEVIGEMAVDYVCGMGSFISGLCLFSEIKPISEVGAIRERISLLTEMNCERVVMSTMLS